MKLKPTYKSIIFDLDDTLYPEHTFQASGFLAVAKWLEKQYGLKGFNDVVLRLFNGGARGHLFNEALDQLDFAWDKKLITELVTVFRDHSPHITMYKDAVDLLLNIESKGLPIGLITDGYATVQRRKIKALGLSDRFDVVVVTDEFGQHRWKPDPFPYNRVMKKLGLAGDECVYIGDNPVKDFITARCLGWQSVRIRRPNSEHGHVNIDTEHEADLTITSLNDFIGLLH